MDLRILGVYGSYADLEPTIERYRNTAAHIYFPYPHDLPARGTPVPPPSQWSFLEMEFNRAQVAAIAAQFHP